MTKESKSRAAEVASQGTHESHSAVDQAVDMIRDHIREQSLQVGDLLPTEKEMAAMFGAGRNSIREAIRILKAYGIVESRQKLGTVITDRRWDAVLDVYSFGFDISADRFTDIQGFRRIIEIHSIELIAKNFSRDSLAKLNDINEELRQSDPKRGSELDFEFHRELVAIAGNQTMSDVYQILRPILTQLMRLGKDSPAGIERTYLEHCDILEALEQDDRIAYAYHMSKHLKAGLKFAPE